MAQADMLADAEIPGRKAQGWAWALCWLMFASTVLNYMDRQAISLVKPMIVGEYHVAPEHQNEVFGWILAAFQLTYALSQVPAGYLADRWNVRWAYAGAVAWWSLAGMAAALSPTLGALMAFRALLGVGESFNWPCALRVTGIVLPPADRALGNGIFNSGAAVGAVLTPPVVTLLTVWFSWRFAFVTIGVLGFAWVAVWLVFVGGAHRARFAGRDASRSRDDSSAKKRMSPAAQGTFLFWLVVCGVVAFGAVRFGASAIWWAIALFMIGLLVIALALPRHTLVGPDWAESLADVVRMPRFWILAIVSVSINVCWHFLVSWLPTVLRDDRGMEFVAGGLLSAIPFLAADVGNLSGGAISRFLAQRGFTTFQARMAVLVGCSVLISMGAFVGFIPSNAVVVVVLALMALGTAAFMANYFAFCQEVSERHTGLVVGILGGLGNLFAAGFAPLAGLIRDRIGSFTPVFLVVGLLPYVGLAVLAGTWNRTKPAPE